MNIFSVKPKTTTITLIPAKAVLGKSVVVLCESHGSPEPSYSIFHNNSEISNWKILTIPNIKRSDLGLYCCIATNKLGRNSKCYFFTVAGESCICYYFEI